MPVVPEVKARMQVSSAAVAADLLELQAGRRGFEQVGRQRRIAERMRDLGDLDHGLELLGTQQRHGGHGNATSLHHAEPAGHGHRVVGPAQQHAVAGHQAHVLHQHLGDAVGLLAQLPVGPADAAALQAQAFAPAALVHGLVQQLGGAVQLLRELQIGQLEQELGPLLARRQVLGGEAV